MFNSFFPNHHVELKMGSSCLLLLLCLFGVCNAFNHHLSLDPNNEYKMWWKFDDYWITVKLQVKTLGWIGWGLSQNGKMKGSDIVLFYYDSNNNPVVEDTHAQNTTSGHGLPVKDVKQDYELIEMIKDNIYTNVTFKRPRMLCNEDDKSVTQETGRVIFAYGSSREPSYHGVKRNTHSVLLIDYADKANKQQPSDTITKEMRMDNTITIPNESTTYFCKTFKIWSDIQEKHHLIRMEPIIEVGHENLVHHILLYECRSLTNESTSLGSTHECSYQNMPDDIKSCRSVAVHAWAIGGTEMDYPEVAGLSMGATNDPVYYMMEVHYDNPQQTAGIKDTSGLKFYLTKNIRQYDATVLAVGTDTGPHAIILPQQQESFKWIGYCSPSCFQVDPNAALKPQVFATVLHAHLSGVKLILRLVRDSDGKEVKRISQDFTYDFNFQEVKVLPELVEIPPGHSFQVDCHYNTMDRSKPVLGGEETSNEMCLAFLWYYPALSHNWCTSLNVGTFRTFQTDVLGWQVDPITSKITQDLVLGGKNYNGRDAYEALHEAEVWEGKPENVAAWQEFQNQKTFIQNCPSLNGPNKVIVPFLNSTLSDYDCTTNPPPPSSGYVNKQNIVNIILVVTVVYGCIYKLLD